MGIACDSPDRRAGAVSPPARYLFEAEPEQARRAPNRTSCKRRPSGSIPRPAGTRLTDRKPRSPASASSATSRAPSPGSAPSPPEPRAPSPERRTIIASTHGQDTLQKVWDAHTVRQLPNGQTQLFVGLHLIHEVTTPQAFDMLRARGWRCDSRADGRRPSITSSPRATSGGRSST